MAGIRIIGGHLRGRKLAYSGDLRTRPMKDRVREAMFNLLGNDVVGTHALDLFAGSGALALEALSRGSVRATFIEQHFPTADLIRQNVAALGVAEQSQVHAANTLLWVRRRPALPLDRPWLVFCSPPYAFYSQRAEAMRELLAVLAADAPLGSLLVVEADDRFDLAELPGSYDWQVRPYPPAVLAIGRRESGPPPPLVPGEPPGDNAPT